MLLIFDDSYKKVAKNKILISDEIIKKDTT